MSPHATKWSFLPLVFPRICISFFSSLFLFFIFPLGASNPTDSVCLQVTLLFVAVLFFTGAAFLGLSEGSSGAHILDCSFF